VQAFAGPVEHMVQRVRGNVYALIFGEVDESQNSIEVLDFAETINHEAVEPLADGSLPLLHLFDAL
jgi:hypothetical protein